MGTVKENAQIKACVISASWAKSHVNVYQKNAEYIARKFGWILVRQQDDYNTLADKFQFDVFIIFGANNYFQAPKLLKLLENYHNPRLIWVVNEYNSSINHDLGILLAENNGLIVSNFPHEAFKVRNLQHLEYVVLNFNSWRINPLITQIDKRPYPIIYYGTYRPNRLRYFQKYFHKPLIVSTAKKNWKYFLKHGLFANYIPAINWDKHILKQFQTSLYIEDEFTHTHYNFLANRFYESINYGTIPVFDVSCLNTIRKSGYPYLENLLVNGLDEALELANRIPKEKEKYQKWLLEWQKIAVEEKAKTTEKFYNLVVKWVKRS